MALNFIYLYYFNFVYKYILLSQKAQKHKNFFIGVICYIYNQNHKKEHSYFS